MNPKTQGAEYDSPMSDVNTDNGVGFTKKDEFTPPTATDNTLAGNSVELTQPKTVDVLPTPTKKEESPSVVTTMADLSNLTPNERFNFVQGNIESFRSMPENRPTVSNGTVAPDAQSIIEKVDAIIKESKDAQLKLEQMLLESPAIREKTEAAIKSSENADEALRKAIDELKKGK